MRHCGLCTAGICGPGPVPSLQSVRGENETSALSVVFGMRVIPRCWRMLSSARSSLRSSVLGMATAC